MWIILAVLVLVRPEIIAEYAELGVDRLLFLVRPEPRDQVLPKLDRIAALLPRPA